MQAIIRAHGGEVAGSLLLLIFGDDIDGANSVGKSSVEISECDRWILELIREAAELFATSPAQQLGSGVTPIDIIWQAPNVRPARTLPACNGCRIPVPLRIIRTADTIQGAS